MEKVTAFTKEDVENCPIRQVLSQVTGKWQMLIILSLSKSPLRFGELKRTIGEITQRVLTENLRKLERDGHVLRSVNPGPPVAVTYSLTDRGIALVSRLLPLVSWAMDEFSAIMASRQEYSEK